MEIKNAPEAGETPEQKSPAVESSSVLDAKETELVGGFYSIPFWKIWVITFGTAVGLTLIGVWQLLLVAGFLGGFLPKGLKVKRGLLIGFMGGLAAWMFLFGFYALTTEMPVFLERLLVDIIGLDRFMIPVLFLICSTFGGIFCGLGGMNGVLISRLVQVYRKSHSSVRN